MKEKEYHDATACNNPGSNLAISKKIQRFWFTLYAHTNYCPIRKIIKINLRILATFVVNDGM
jgi:hypothetical protein